MLRRLLVRAIRWRHCRPESQMQGGQTSYLLRLHASASRWQVYESQCLAGFPTLVSLLPDTNRDLPRPQASVRRLLWRGEYASCYGNLAQRLR